MRLSKPMIEMFSQIAKGNNTINSLVKTLNKSANRITEIAQELSQEGFIIKKNNFLLGGSRISYQIANTSHARKFKEIVFEYPTIRFEEILADSRLLFLSSISDDWISIKVSQQLSGVSKFSIERYRYELRSRGVIVRKKSLYRVNEKMWPLLKDFLIAYKNYSSIEGQVKWKYQQEIIYKVNDETQVKGNATGFYAYKDYGVQVGVISALCISPLRKLSKEEIFVHSLFEVDDPRTLHLALTFYLKNRLSYEKVMLVAMKYGKYSVFENMIKALKSNESKVRFENLPAFERKDFKRIASMYGVKNV